MGASQGAIAAAKQGEELRDISRNAPVFSLSRNLFFFDIGTILFISCLIGIIVGIDFYYRFGDDDSSTIGTNRIESSTKPFLDFGGNFWRGFGAGAGGAAFLMVVVGYGLMWYTDAQAGTLFPRGNNNDGVKPEWADHAKQAYNSVRVTVKNALTTKVLLAALIGAAIVISVLSLNSRRDVVLGVAIGVPILVLVYVAFMFNREVKRAVFKFSKVNQKDGVISSLNDMTSLRSDRIDAELDLI